MRIIAVANQKGGCGKTTTAINLAASLSVNNRKVLLIDLDPQAHATLGLNIKADLNIYNILSKITNKKAYFGDIIKNVDVNFDIAPSGVILSTIEQELAGEIGRESRLKDVLHNFKHEYNYMIIDCPPNLGILTVNAMRAANEVIVPVEASRFALEGLTQLLDIINLIRDRLSHNVEYHVLVTNFDSRLRHSFKVLGQIKATFKDKLFGNMIHVNVKLKEAQTQGLHVLSYDKYSRGAKDYFSLAREIITQEKSGVHAAMPEIHVPMSSRLEQKMKEMLKTNLPRLGEMIFSVAAPDAKEVYLAGDFNGWRLDNESRMRRDKSGTWRKGLNLKDGKYHYRFVIDGRWVDDPVNPNREVNPYGQMDSLIEVIMK